MTLFKKWKGEEMKFTYPILEEDPIADQLDQDQLAAVKFRGGNLLIVAGAGSGKTRTLTYRTISLMKELGPEHLMVVTFTKKAAKEILERISKHVPGSMRKALKQAWIGTIHSICWRMLMENGSLVGLEENWSVLDMNDSLRVMSAVARSFGYRDDSRVRELYQLYSFARNAMVDWRELANTQRFPNVPRTDTTAKILAGYTRRCRRSNRVDFDDLQVLAVKLLEKYPKVRRHYQERFKAILVDEYQDTSKIQERLLRLLWSGENVITAVGDDAQAIYGFRAATVDNILNFEQTFQAKRITLRTNYRSTPEIVRLSNASIRHNLRQIQKEIKAKKPAGRLPVFYKGRTQRDEAEFILKVVQENFRKGIPLRDMAVLFRTTRLAASLEIALKRAGIPYELRGGEDFFSLEHIKLILDMARLLVNPEDSIALASLQELLQFGSAEVLYSVESDAEARQLSFWTVAKENARLASPLEKQALDSLLQFEKELARLRQMTKEDHSSLTPVMTAIIEYLSKALKRRFASSWEDVKADLDTLQTIAAEYHSLGDFLNSVELEQFVDAEDPQQDVLVLTTIHSAKGLEWECVFVMGLVEFWFPLNYAIQQSGTDEEERRLFYVAVTRAKSQLYLSSYGNAVTRYGTRKTQVVSRFVRELPTEVYEEFTG